LPLTFDYLHLAPEVLFALCADGGDARAWEEFLRRYESLIQAVAKRTARRYPNTYTGVCDDLVQDVYLKLATDHGRILRGFRYRKPGSDRSFLAVVTANWVRDFFKMKDQASTEPISADDLSDAVDYTAKLFAREVDDVLRRFATEKEREIVWLFYRYSLTAREIALIPSLELTEDGVESVLFRMRVLIREKLLGPKGKQS